MRHRFPRVTKRSNLWPRRNQRRARLCYDRGGLFAEVLEDRRMLSILDPAVDLSSASPAASELSTVDPVPAWSAYLGGSGSDYGRSVAVDAAGNAFVTGYTASTDFDEANNGPITGAGGLDAFVAMVSPSGATQWVTYLGGSNDDLGRGVALDAAGNILLTGETSSSDFDGSNSFHRGGWDAFVAKLSPNGVLQWAAYLGGSGDEFGQGIAVDAAGNALVTGYTTSTDFDAANNASNTGGVNQDVFVAKVSPAGLRHWATYLGEKGNDLGRGIAVDAAGNALVTGETSSSKFEGRNNLHHGGWDAFVAMISPSGVLQWATYLGGSGNEFGQGVSVDAAANAFVTGYTTSINFDGATNAANSSAFYQDAFVAKVSPGGLLRWATYVGGGADDLGRGIAVDAAGNVLVTGETSSGNFEGHTNSHHGGTWDTFVAKVSPEGRMQGATYLGGSGAEYGRGIALDAAGSIFVAGETTSTTFTGANNTYEGGDWDGFVAKITFPEGNQPPRIESLTAAPDPIVRPGDLTLTATGATDSDGQVAAVRFYRDDELLGIDADGTDGWSLAVTTFGWTLGEHSLSAQAEDNNWQWSAPASATVTVANAVPVVASLLAVGDSAGRPMKITLTATAVGDPDGRVAAVEFRREEELLGIDTDGSDGWNVTVSSMDWPLGEFTFSARAQDDDGAWSEPAVTTITIADSVLAWSTYLGGSDDDGGRYVALDADGNILIAGGTSSAAWIAGGYDTSYHGAFDAFVAKLSPAGEPIWSTYLGGSGEDWGLGVAVDSAGNVYVTGETDSPGWTSNGYDTIYEGGGDVFVTKLSPTGEHIWSTYLGGAGEDIGLGVRVDPAGNLVVVGETSSSEWAQNGYDTNYKGNGDGFVAKLSPAGDLIWGTYLGGGSSDQCHDIAVDSMGNIALAGRTSSSGWVSGGYDTSHGGGSDGFAAKLSATGELLWSTYLGGGSGDYGYGIAVDSLGNVLATGRTWSGGWVSGGYDTAYDGGGDIYVAKLSPTGAHIWSTYLGGNDGDRGDRIAVDNAGNILFTGYTRSGGWVSGGFDVSYPGSYDAFVAKLRPTGEPVWSSYLGGSDKDWGFGIAVDPGGNAIVTGESRTPGWISGGFDTSFNGGGYRGDAFVAKIRQNQATLGTVDFLTLGSQDPTAGDLWYRFQTSHDAILTVEADADAHLALFDESLNQLAVSAPVAGHQRIEYSASAGQDFLLQLIGAAGITDLRIANLVQHEGTAVTVYGTGGDDQFVFDASGGLRRLSINGVLYEFTAAEAIAISFDGAGGNDQVQFVGSAGVDTARLRPGSTVLNGDSFAVAARNIESSTFHGAGGQDIAFLHGGRGSDVFTAGAAEPGADARVVTLAGNGFSLAVTAPIVYAYGHGGCDEAYFYESPGHDVYQFVWKWAAAWNDPDAEVDGDEYYRKAKEFNATVGCGGPGLADAVAEDVRVEDAVIQNTIAGDAIVEDAAVVDDYPSAADISALAQILWLNGSGKVERSTKAGSRPEIDGIDQIFADWDGHPVAM